MSRLLVFTENYNVPAGGASYIVDLSNGAATLFDDIVFASNPRGFAPDTSSRVTVPHVMRTIRVCTADRIGVDVTAAAWLPKRHAVAHALVRRAIGRDPRLFARNVSVCRRAIRKVRPSAVLAFNGGYPAGRSVLSMVVAARQEGLPVALCVVSVPVARPDGELGKWEARMDAMVDESADVIIVNAHAIGSGLVELRNLSESRIKVIHNSLADREVPVAAAGHVLFRIGCVSRMEQMKGTRFLVEAFAVVADTNPNAQLMLVGDGPERENVERLVSELGLGRRVIMTGQYRGDVAELISTFDIYAFPSLWEGLPYALLEAMRAGRPIVATDVGGVSEAIVDGVTGLLVPPASAQALATAIQRLMDDVGLRTRLGTAARVSFENSFSLDAMHRRTAAILLEAGLAVP